MYRVFKFTHLPISLPGKEMDPAEVARPSVSPSVRGEQFPTTMFRSRSLAPTTPSWHWTEWNGMVHLLMSQASASPSLHLAVRPAERARPH